MRIDSRQVVKVVLIVGAAAAVAFLATLMYTLFFGADYGVAFRAIEELLERATQ